MRIKIGEKYTCKKCNCELTVTENPESCSEECNLTCCGSLMGKK